MPVEFRIIPGLNLSYVRYSGVMSIEEGGKAFSAYMQHPDYRPGQKQLVDLSDVTNWERDFATLIAFQARKADVFYDPEHPTLIVALAPSKTARRVADIVARSWDEIEGTTYLTAASALDAIELLGLPKQAASEIFRNA